MFWRAGAMTGAANNDRCVRRNSKDAATESARARRAHADGLCLAPGAGPARAALRREPRRRSDRSRLALRRSEPVRASPPFGRCWAGTSARSPTCSACDFPTIPSRTGWCCRTAPSRATAARSAYPPDTPLRVEPDRWRRSGRSPEPNRRATLPFGPVRADVVESAEFIFFYVGEHILHYHPHLFFKHRGMEKRFEGADPARGACWPSASPASAASPTRWPIARQSKPPPMHRAAARAVAARAAGGTGAGLQPSALPRASRHTTTLKVGEAQGKLLEERAKQINARLTGSRFLRSLLTRRSAPRPATQALAERALEALRAETRQLRRCWKTPTAISTA